MSTTTTKHCGTCVHRIEIPGDCHIGCANLKAKPKRRVWAGCGVWPLNFDSNTVQSCDGWSDKPEDRTNQKDHPLMALARMLAGR